MFERMILESKLREAVQGDIDLRPTIDKASIEESLNKVAMLPAGRVRAFIGLAVVDDEDGKGFTTSETVEGSFGVLEQMLKLVSLQINEQAEKIARSGERCEGCGEVHGDPLEELLRTINAANGEAKSFQSRGSKELDQLFNLIFGGR